MSSQVPSHLASTVGRNIKSAREGRGLTQRDLARLCDDLDPQAVSRWERGKITPSHKSLLFLAHVLEQDPAWFYGEHPEPTAAA